MTASPSLGQVGLGALPRFPAAARIRLSVPSSHPTRPEPRSPGRPRTSGEYPSLRRNPVLLVETDPGCCEQEGASAPGRRHPWPGEAKPVRQTQPHPPRWQRPQGHPGGRAARHRRGTTIQGRHVGSCRARRPGRRTPVSAAPGEQGTTLRDMAANGGDITPTFWPVIPGRPRNLPGHPPTIGPAAGHDGMAAPSWPAESGMGTHPWRRLRSDRSPSC